MAHIIKDEAVAEIERVMNNALHTTDKKLKFMVAFDTDFKVCSVPFIPQREDGKFTERFEGWMPDTAVFPKIEDSITIVRGENEESSLVLGWILIGGRLYCG